MFGTGNVSQIARKLSRALDDDAGLEALMQASNCRRNGDASGEAFWLQVQKSLETPQGYGAPSAVR